MTVRDNLSCDVACMISGILILEDDGQSEGRGIYTHIAM